MAAIYIATPAPQGEQGGIVGRVRINFPISISVACFVLLLIMTAWFWRESGSTKETLIFFGAGLAAVGQLAVAFYTARTLTAALNKEDRDIYREQKRHALRFGERWNDASMFNARDTLRAVVNANTKSADEVQKVIDGSETHVIHVMNFLEEIATCHKHDVADKDLLKAQFDFIIVNTWETLLPWIQRHRKSRASHVWDDLENLHFQWKKRT